MGVIFLIFIICFVFRLFNNYCYNYILTIRAVALTNDKNCKLLNYCYFKTFNLVMVSILSFYFFLIFLILYYYIIKWPQGKFKLWVHFIKKRKNWIKTYRRTSLGVLDQIGRRLSPRRSSLLLPGGSGGFRRRKSRRHLVLLRWRPRWFWNTHFLSQLIFKNKNKTKKN